MRRGRLHGASCSRRRLGRIGAGWVEKASLNKGLEEATRSLMRFETPPALAVTTTRAENVLRRVGSLGRGYWGVHGRRGVILSCRIHEWRVDSVQWAGR